jgi:hypothetical protein
LTQQQDRGWPDVAAHKLNIRGKLTEEHVSQFEKGTYSGLILNEVHGFDVPSLSLLGKFSNLESLEVVFGRDQDLSFVENLKTLKRLSIGPLNAATLDFTKLPLLEQVFCHWHDGIKSVLRCKSLKVIGLVNYPGANFLEFQDLARVTHLRLLSPGIVDFPGIEAMSRLEHLWIQRAQRLRHLDGIEYLNHLRILSLESCMKVENIEPLATMDQLEMLDLDSCGNLPSIRPIKNLHRLDSIWLIERTNIVDGDISYLDELPNLIKVYFPNRKHYNRKRENYPPWNSQVARS